MKIIVETPIPSSPRTRQVRGMFDLADAASERLEWDVRLPLGERGWNLGLITGPSGCGKTTVARHLFPDTQQLDLAPWLGRGSVVDAFPDGMPIKEIVALLSAVGFASPPAWLRPFHVLSTGQQFRVALALRLAHAAPGECVVFDEYSSVVDRTVAQIGSAAAARAIRERKQQFVAVTCHDDVEDWLQPDWTYRPAEDRFEWRRLRRRPSVTLEVVRCQASAWELFAPHHYLSHSLAKSAVCFLATWNERPVAFSAWLPFVGAGPRTRREHRTVTLPDYQGIGVGNALSDFVASLWAGLGYRAVSTTTHPAMIRSRLRSPNWTMRRRPAFAARAGRLRHAATRLTAGFEYVGPPFASDAARALVEAVVCSPRPSGDE